MKLGISFFNIALPCQRSRVVVFTLRTFYVDYGTIIKTGLIRSGYFRTVRRFYVDYVPECQGIVPWLRSQIIP
jgi:hypothetical protein